MRIVIGIVVLSAIFAFARGFVREALSIVAWPVSMMTAICATRSPSSRTSSRPSVPGMDRSVTMRSNSSSSSLSTVTASSSPGADPTE